MKLRIPAFIVLLLASACDSAETKQCHAVMTSAQEIVKQVNSKDLASVEQSLAAVEGAIDACQKAGRTGEVDQLTHAKNELGGHASFMREKAARPVRKKRTPEELAQIAKAGDPSCPKGQAYKEEGTNKEIRCTGAQPADMTYSKADEYFRNRGYKITTTESPPTLRAEFGAELYVYTYAAPKDEHAPKCLTLYPAPGIPWMEATSRATGENPRHLEKDKTVAETDHGKVPLRRDETDSKLVIYIGDCG